MYPTLTTPQNLLPILEELKNLEPLYHSAYIHASEDDFEKLVAAEFWEVGASGKPYSREYALKVLRERQTLPRAEDWHSDEYHVSEAGAGVYLLTYRLVQPGRVTRRLSVWCYRNDAWQVIYHQGTVL